MTQAIPKLMTFDEFIAWYPENSEHHHELHNGVIVEMPKPTGKHSRVAGFITQRLGIEIDRRELPYFIPKECVVKPIDNQSNAQSGYEPDVIVLDEQMISNEPGWDKESVITLGASVRLIVEVASTNWEDDYARKLEDYELLGIQEYWIADYLGLGGRRYIGSPKQPTFSVYELVNGEYQVRQFRGSDRIISPNFPDLELTVEQVFAKGK